MGNWYTDFASQADDDAHNPCRDPSEQRAGVDDGRAQRYQQTNGVEVAQAKQRARRQLHAVSAAEHAHAGARSHDGSSSCSYGRRGARLSACHTGGGHQHLRMYIRCCRGRMQVARWGNSLAVSAACGVGTQAWAEGRQPDRAYRRGRGAEGSALSPSGRGAEGV